ncbi:MAG TPA: hypothetical protein VLE99_04020 [Candidatus Saccharimonadales bacterium]|nr:hypothetical protein [Candidatus Saccharimonadales bacterium]
MHRTGYIRLLAVGLALGVLSALGWAGLAHAQVFRSGDNVTVSAGQTVDNSLFTAGRTIDIDGTVNGDVFCAGQNVTISGQVRGDVICAGQDITVSGTVDGDVRLAGQDVTISGQVAGNASVGAQTFLQQSKSLIARDVSLGGQDATLNGSVGRDVAAGSGALNLAGPVGRNVMANVEHLKLENSAKVTGDITYTSNNMLSRSPDAQVQGTVSRHRAEVHGKHLPVLGWLLVLYTYVSCVLVALVLALLVPQVFERAAAVARGRPGITLLTGFVASIVVPVLLGVLAITAIGLPLALLGGLVWLLLVLLASPIAAYLLGRLIFRSGGHAVLIMLVGAAILFLLYLLPIIGFLFWLVGTWFGLGAMLLLTRGMGRPRYTTGELGPEGRKKPAAA